MHAIKQTSKQILILSICTVILINSNVLASQWDITIHEAPTGQFQNSRKKTAQLIEDNNRLRVQPTDETENIGRDNQLFLSLRTVADLYHRYENDNQQNCILQFYTKKIVPASLKQYDIFYLTQNKQIVL